MPVAINFPTDRRIYGVNILVTYGDLGWGSSWDWSAMQSRLDMAKNTLGANCVRMLGDTGSVYRGEVTLANYLARWTLILDYCRSIGLYIYPCALDPDSQFLQDTTLASTINTMTALVALIDDYTDIAIGIDLGNEYNGMGLSVADCGDIYAACHPLTTLGLTFSHVFTSAPGVGGDELNAINAITDFVDVHCHYQVGNISEFDPLRYHNQTKDFIIGEFGSPLSEGESTRTSKYNAAMQLANAGRGVAGDSTLLSPIRGALAWELKSQSNSPNDAGRWGIYAADGTPYSYLVDSFQKNKLVFRPATFGGAMHGGQLHSAPLHADDVLPLTSSTFTASAALTTSNATLAASATFSAGTHTATSTLSITKATVVSTATFSPGTHTATASLTASRVTIISAATFKQLYTGTASLSVSNTTIASSALFASGVFQATASLLVTKAAIAASATFVAAAHSSTAALSVTKAIIASAATFVRPVYTATVGVTTSNTTLIASAQSALAIRTGRIAVTTTNATATLLATFTPSAIVVGPCYLVDAAVYVPGIVMATH